MAMDEFTEAFEEEVREARAMDEVRDLMAECFGFGVSLEAVADLRDSAEDAWEEGHKWGFEDTVVREELMSALSKLLVGKPAPTYGEVREQGLDSDAYFASLAAAHNTRYGVAPKPHWLR